jgi:hypothetical protein
LLGRHSTTGATLPAQIRTGDILLKLIKITATQEIRDWEDYDLRPVQAKN